MQPLPPSERPIAFSWDPAAALREGYRVALERLRGGSAAAVARAGGELSGA